MNWKIRSRGGKQTVPTKVRLLDFVAGEEAGSTGRDDELKPRTRHNLSGSCEKIAGREVAAGLPRHICSIVRTAMAG